MNQLITLEQWNSVTFGGRFAINTLRSWARNGYIMPAAQKIGRDWLVDQSARFHKPKKPVAIPANIDTNILPTDPLVLAILNQSS